MVGISCERVGFFMFCRLSVLMNISPFFRAKYTLGIPYLKGAEMKRITPDIVLDDCEEKLEYYKNIFGGEINRRQENAQ